MGQTVAFGNRIYVQVKNLLPKLPILHLAVSPTASQFLAGCALYALFESVTRIGQIVQDVVIALD